MKRTKLLLFILMLGIAYAATPRAEKIQSLAALKPAPGGERRLALVIGNSAYKTSPLRNPVNDARAISRALAETGFKVTLIEDAGRATMRRVVREWGDELARGGVGLFYFAGHGMQIRGKNYLIPVSADIEREDEVEDEAVDANTILAKMDSAKNSLNVMILDACRNNPFQRSFRSAQQGLAQMDAPSATIVAFATAPGSVASDGSGANGLYTEHLLKAIRQPGLPIEQLFKQVRIGVTKETSDKQIPWESSSLKGDFYFLPPDPNAAGATQKAAVDKAVSDAVKQAEDRAARERADMQRKMEQMIAEALAKQKAMIEAERRAAGLAPAAAEPAPTKPVQVASIAPTPAAVPKLQQALSGDRWLYRGVEVQRQDRKHEVLIEVLGAAESGVIEVVNTASGGSTQWVYTPEPILVGFGNGFANLSLGIGSGEANVAGKEWARLPFERLAPCTGSQHTCSASAKVVGKESVKTPAGVFDSLKISATVLARANFQFSGSGIREYTFWYSEALGRVVKFSHRSDIGRLGADPDVQFELVAYQKTGREPVGNFSTAVAMARPAEEAAPIVVASLAPVSPVAPTGPAVPKAGDRWEYSLKNISQNQISKRVVEIADVGTKGIRERISGDDGMKVSLVHPGGITLSEPGMIQLSPYLLAFADRSVGASLNDIAIVQLANCATRDCGISARVAAAEKITVPAGTFDSLKVVVNVRLASSSAIEFTYWYAREAKRIVKGSGRGSGFMVTMPNFDFELVSYRLQ